MYSLHYLTLLRHRLSKPVAFVPELTPRVILPSMAQNNKFFSRTLFHHCTGWGLVRRVVAALQRILPGHNAYRHTADGSFRAILCSRFACFDKLGTLGGHSRPGKQEKPPPWSFR